EAATLTGKVVRVLSFPGRWIYGVSLDTPPEKEYLSYLQIIYDGFNQSLPQFRDPFSTLFDQLIENITRRVASNKPQESSQSKTPQLFLEEEGTLKEGKGVAERFDFHTMTLKKMENLPLSKETTFEVDTVQFQLSFRQEQEEIVIYDVVNLAELIENKKFERLI